MIRDITIKNYKSILDHTIELGRINVFIGENGCGKTNILEAMAMAGAALTDKLDVEDLFARGIRVAKPSITFSSFAGAKAKEITLRCSFDGERTDEGGSVDLHIMPSKGSAAHVKWHEKKPRELHFNVDSPGSDEKIEALVELSGKLNEAPEEKDTTELMPQLALALKNLVGPSNANAIGRFLLAQTSRIVLSALIGEFAIYNPNALALRGMQVVSRKAPLGIYGENLDVAISALKKDVWGDLLRRAKCVSWVDDIVVDPRDELKYAGHKLGQSKSTLYFHDRFMRRRHNIFSAENVNEGILHILFYFTLFVSEDSPKVFGIDNIETALNPQLCRDLMKQLAELAAAHGKQALITTHNPAILDGLNLHNDEQRLFVVSRDDNGHTVTERIRLKPSVKDAKYKLSELWMRGHLGGLPPQGF